MSTMAGYNTRVGNEMDYLRAAKHGCMDDLMRLEAVVTNPVLRCSAAGEAAKAGHVACMEYLVGLADLDDIYDHCLRNAVMGQQVLCIEAVVQKSTPNLVYMLLVTTVRTHNTTCFDAMLAHTHGSFYQGLFNEAVLSGNRQAFYTLLPHIDPKHNNSLGLQVACLKGHAEMFDVLYLVSDPIVARAQLTEHNTFTDLLDERIEQDRLNGVLTQATNNEHATRTRKI